MKYDIVFPDGNEGEFISVAEKLEIKNLYLVYPYQKELRKQKELVSSLQKLTKIKLHFGIIAKKPNDIIKAKRIYNFVITESSSNDATILEKIKPNLVFGFETSERKDKMHYVISGLNQVLCKLASKNNITIGFSFSMILNAKKEKRIQLLGRMKQNIKFCKKYKVKVLFASFTRKPYEMRATKDFEALLRFFKLRN